MKRLILVLILLPVICVTTFAGHKDQAPLPDAIKNAKTVFADNRTRWADVSDNIYKEFKHWTRYSLVDDSSKADLVLVFTEGPSHTSERFSAVTSGNVVSGRTTQQSICSVTMAVLDKNGNQLWMNSMNCSRRGATADLIRDLKARLSH